MQYLCPRAERGEMETKMNNQKRIVLIIVFLTFCVSLYSIFLLPNEFYFRFNLASEFHLAQKYELLIVPISVLIIVWVFRCIRSVYEKQNDLIRVTITNIAIIFIALFGFVVNFIFILEAFNNLENSVFKLFERQNVYILNSVLMIALGGIAEIFLKEKWSKIISFLIICSGIIGLILIVVCKSNNIPLIYFGVILMLFITTVFIKFYVKHKK